MKLLLDMNLAPAWVQLLGTAGFDAVHWSTVGRHDAKDAVVMEWAREHQRVILTHDLGFSALLASSRSTGPSVVLLRTQDVLPAALAEMLVEILHQHRLALTGGAILSVDESASRLRILPLGEAPPGD